MIHYVQLRAFQAVATHAGFSKAAEALGLTQPAISDQVRRLEQAYGVILFNRRGKTVEPTEIGRRLLAVTQEMFNCQGNAEALLLSAAALETGNLVMAADAPDLAMKLIAPFRRKFPNVTVSLTVANAEACLQRVLSRAADIAVTASAPVDQRLRGLELRRETLAALVPSGRAIKGRSISFEALLSHGLIFREPHSLTQRLLVRELSRVGLSAASTLSVEGREALIAAVAAGIGVGVIAPSEFGFNEGVRILPIAGATGVLTEYLVSQTDQILSRLVNEIYEVGEAIRNAPGRPSGPWRGGREPASHPSLQTWPDPQEHQIEPLQTGQDDRVPGEQADRPQERNFAP